MKMPRHEGVRGDYSKVVNVPDRHPDSLYMIATGPDLAQRNMDDFSFNDLLFMYECVKYYGLNDPATPATRKGRLVANNAILKRRISEF